MAWMVKRKLKDPTDPEMLSRFWSKVNKDTESGCWEWIGCGATHGKGYGLFSVGNKVNAPAHRCAYQICVGEIPDGYVVDHLCRNPSCVNPDHLEAITQSENVKRGVLPDIMKAKFSLITHCPKGHEYSEENTRIKNGSHRVCMQCAKDYGAKRYWSDPEYFRAKRREQYTVQPPKTHCPQGHEYNEENARVDKRGYKSCRVCGKIRAQAKRDRLKAERELATA